MVAILDADKEGFLRSERSLIQTAGRAARNVDGKVILYADVVTESIRKTMDETNRRRTIQAEFNRENNITPETIRKDINDILSSLAEQDYVTVETEEEAESEVASIPVERISREIDKLTAQMFEAARDLEFEKAAELRDLIRALEQKQIKYGSP